VRREAERHQRVLAAAVAQLEALAQVVGRVRRVRGRKVDHDQAERHAHAGRLRRFQRRFREEVHVVEAGDAPAQHLGAGERGAVAHELGRDVLVSAGQMCSCSQRISGRSSDMPRISDIAACVWALTSPGIRT
jgi:hypothetical protein